MSKPLRLAKPMLAALAAGIAFAGVHGFAASLGATTGGLGADGRPIGSCGAKLTLSYTTAFDPGAAGYAVSGIDVSNIPAGCLGRSVSVSFYGSDDRAEGAAVRAILPATGGTDDISVDPGENMIHADKVAGASLAVS
jgi:hypothetical protein